LHKAEALDSRKAEALDSKKLKRWTPKIGVQTFRFGRNHFLESYPITCASLLILWFGKEIVEYDVLKKEAEKVQEELSEYVKNVLRSHFRKVRANR
jgi:hypothetical protein